MRGRAVRGKGLRPYVGSGRTGVRTQGRPKSPRRRREWIDGTFPRRTIVRPAEKMARRSLDRCGLNDVQARRTTVEVPLKERVAGALQPPHRLTADSTGVVRREVGVPEAVGFVNGLSTDPNVNASPVGVRRGQPTPERRGCQVVGPTCRVRSRPLLVVPWPPLRRSVLGPGDRGLTGFPRGPT